MLLALAVVLLGGFAAYAAHILLGLGGEMNPLFDNWLYDGLMVGASGVCILRAVLVRRERLAWALIGAALAAWALGEVYWTFVLADVRKPPFPSPADAAYLAFYPLVCAGLVLLVRSRIRNLRPSLVLDGLIGALAVASIGAEVVLEPVLRRTSGSFTEIAATVAYPLGDILVLGFVAAVLLLTGLRPGRSWALLMAGLAAMGLADAIYSYQWATGSYVAGTSLDLLWPAGIILIAAAAWQPVATGERWRPEGWRALAVPSAFAAFVIGLEVFERLEGAEPAASAALESTLGVALLAAVIARMITAFAENQRLLQQVRSDHLTRLGNRGKLSVDLPEALASGQPRVLVMFDLDGFKAYNDSFGHPAGDALLTRLGRRLADSVRGRGEAYRIGGDEFCALLEGTLDAATPAIAGGSAALGERGRGFKITSSLGSVEMPVEADSADAALQLADQRMYAQKDSRRVSAERQAEAVLLRIISERSPELGEHLHGVSQLAVAVGRRLGLGPGELTALARAAELHDVGKVAIPDAILDKPGPLTDEDWDFVRQHTVLGERILASAPALASVAHVVRSTHERYDGDGYPDGLAGERIPLASRIIFVCDAFHAMTSRRPYSANRSAEEATAELRRCAGTQFDPAVVDTFCATLADGIPSLLDIDSPDSANETSDPRAGLVTLTP